MILEINTLAVFVEMLQFIVPALVVFLVCYLLIRKFFEEEYKQKLLKLKTDQNDLLTPIKLQAYERLTLLLDRIRPENLILRMSDPKLRATEFKYVLERTINDEYAHNVSQQIYVSNQAWNLITGVKDHTLNVINNCYKDMKEGDSAVEFGKKILTEMMVRDDQSSQVAIDFLKKEMSIVF